MAPPPGQPLPERMQRCRVCSAALATDQRWCIECGTRRGPVAPAMQALIGLPSSPASAAEPPPRRDFALPNPRAAAVAISAILGFGVIVGSVVSPAAESATSAPIVVAVRPSSPAQPPAPAVPEPPASTPSPDTTVAGSAPAPAPAPQQQVVYQTQPSPPPSAPAAPKPLPVPPMAALPPVTHVFVVMLSGHGYDAAFGPTSAAPYLAKTLTAQGELIPNYYAIAHGGLDNEIALLAGQGPTKQTAADCPTYTDVAPGTPGDQGQAQGDGCVYPADTKTLADQLFAGGNVWKAYIEDLAKGPGGCNHPAAGSADPNHDPRPGDDYVTWRNPFLYFHSLIDSPACGSNMADLGQLSADLKQVGDTPSLSYIVPNRCHDGSDTDCGTGGPAGLASADAWLQTVIPQIEGSPAYKQGGLIAITFDATPTDGPEADSSSCCGQPATYPNLPADDPSQQPNPSASQPSQQAEPNAPQPSQQPADPSASQPPQQPDPSAGDPAGAGGPPPGGEVKTTGGGGKVGLLLISPYVKPNTVNTSSYFNHYSLFASLEDLFSLGHIAYANLPDLTTFDSSVYTAYQGGASSQAPPAHGSRARRARPKR